MSPYSQELSASRRNPFEISPKSGMAHSPNRGGRAGASHASAVRSVPRRQSGPATRPQSPGTETKRAQTRSVRRQQVIKKSRFQGITQGLKQWRGLLKWLAIVALAFVLLPAPVQKRFFGLIHATSEQTEQLESAHLPVMYEYISSPFGKRWGRLHQGIDFAADSGSPIYATADGTVTYSGWEPGYGKSVIIDHGNGMQTRYAHCSRLLVKVGAEVTQGAMIAKVGSTGHSTGPHLHFEVIVNGVRKNPAWYYTFAQTGSEHLASAED